MCLKTEATDSKESSHKYATCDLYQIELQHIGLCGDGFNIEGGKLEQIHKWRRQRWLGMCMP